ncbi:MAG TPA: MobF family relaxase, partial [Candidatus Babeliaceae bacterium]|nr:MobF family relaxase [Candidatus Babeliaceae bacterium]
MMQSQSAEQAKKYFNDALLKSDYFFDSQELQGNFNGKLAARLGVTGVATKEAFHRLCSNLHPVTGQKLTQRTIGNRTTGYDINFHVPKSVSILHALSQDGHILIAFRDSVHDTMRHIEADAKTRVRKDGKDHDRVTGELLYADFIHQTSRPVAGFAPDPHLHCHCFTFNATWDETEQSFKAAQFRDIKADMPYYQACFFKTLSDRLMALGYKIRLTEKPFEIDGVPQAAIDQLSKRTNEIGQVAKRGHIKGTEQLAALGS